MLVKSLIGLSAAMITIALAAPAVVRAHDVLYAGTVLSVEALRLQVTTADPETKKTQTARSQIKFR